MDYPEVTKEDVNQWRSDNDLEPVTIPTFHILQASNLVYDYLKYCVWDAENPAHVQAIKDAVAFTVSLWEAANINPLSEGLTSNLNTVSSASLNGGSFTNANPAARARKRDSSTSTLTGDAARILTLAGIRLPVPRVVG